MWDLVETIIDKVRYGNHLTSFKFFTNFNGTLYLVGCLGGL